jgi:hypothetical protein
MVQNRKNEAHAQQNLRNASPPRLGGERLFLRGKGSSSSSSSSAEFGAKEAGALLETMDAANQKNDFLYPSKLLTFAFGVTSPTSSIDEEIRIQEGRYLYWKKNSVTGGVKDQNIQYFYFDDQGQGIAAYDFGSDKHYSAPSKDIFASLIGEQLAQLQSELKSLIATSDGLLLEILNRLEQGTFASSRLNARVTSNLSSFVSLAPGSLSGELLVQATSASGDPLSLNGNFSYAASLPERLSLRGVTGGKSEETMTYTLKANYAKMTPLYPNLEDFASFTGGGFLGAFSRR